MVSSATTTMTSWFSDVANTKRSLPSLTVGLNLNLNLNLLNRSPPLTTLQILSFETAKIMSRLVSLYKSLSDHEISKLRKEVMRSPGVAYLNSKDEGFLLNLACAERLEELDYAAIAISRLGRKCTDFGMKRFDLVYNDLKLGIIDMGKLNYGSKEIEKIVEKMNKYISSTSALYSAIESLMEMETSERKLSQWRKNLDKGRPTQRANFDLFDQKISFQRKQVKHYREVSLWSQTFDKSVAPMARIVFIVYARICFVFGPYISGLPQLSSRQIRLLPSPNKQHFPIFAVSNYCATEEQQSKPTRVSKSGPIPKISKKWGGITRFGSQESNFYYTDDGIGVGVGFGIKLSGRNAGKAFDDDESSGKYINKVMQAASPSTVGGAGLALRYANVIITAEKLLQAENCTINEDGRHDLYQLLPECLKLKMKSKLGRRESSSSRSNEGDDMLAEGWREALKGLLGWLAPMAHDTVKWYAERNFEKQKIDAKPMVLLLQTLQFSDKEKAEAAIVEVLVGLSCIFRYENRQSDDSCGGGCGSYSS